MKLTTEEMEADRIAVTKGDMEVGEFVDKHFDQLFALHMHEMPYGTAKARTGDPHFWLDRYYEKELLG